MGAFRSITVSILLISSLMASAQQQTLLDRFLLFLLAEEHLMASSKLSYSAMVETVGTVAKPASVRRAQARLERVMGRELTINVLDDPTFNASAYPHGDMFINIGAVEYLNHDEGMIATILGHEIAHVERKHSLERFKQQILVNTVVAGFLSDGDLESLAPFLAAAITSRYSRDHELKSDRYGFGYAVRAGYSSFAPQRTFEVMAGLSSSSAGKLTHDLHREIGSQPDVIVGESVFMNVMMNLPGSVFTKRDHPRFAVTPQVGGFLAILKISPNQEAGMLVPNPYERIIRCTKGEQIDVPSVHYRTEKGELVRLRWDQTGTFKYLFVLSEARIDYGSLVGQVYDLESRKQAVKELAKEQQVLVFHTAKATISVADEAADAGGNNCERS